MFVSPCSLRSTQCAALIALATVAGIARVETSPQPNGAANGAESNTLTASATRPASPCFTLAPTSPAPWLHPFATLALWFLSADDRTGPHLAVATASSPDQAPVTATLLTPPNPPAETTEPSVFHRSAPRVASGSRSHLIPFAVGPPPSPLTPNLRANGTPVPTVDFARRLFVSPVAHFSFRLVARLACGSFSRHPWVGPVFPPRFALRGAPGSLPAPPRFRPSLCADEALTGRLFLL